ncbi:hypothetical protein, partial [Sansalvadorimonas verongulae]|uniref:hypothetical protein n=1 Tax=Sansalvadorimonas verongulae TaxID=2172824 RepID=UPI001E48E179
MLLGAGADPTLKWQFWISCTKSPLEIAQDKRDKLPPFDPKRLQYGRIITSLMEAENKHRKHRQTSQTLWREKSTGEPHDTETSVSTGMSKLSLRRTSEK